MDRYRVAPTLHAADAPRPVFISSSVSHGGGSAAGRRSGGAELDIFAAERYFNAADVIKSGAAAAVVPALPNDEPAPRVAVDAASQSGRTAVSSEASWNSRSGLLSSNQSAAATAGKHDKGFASNGVAAASDRYYHRGGKARGSGQRWGLFSRDCPCAGRKAVTVDVASEPRSSPTTPRVHASFDATSVVTEESTIFKAKELPPPTPSDESTKMKIIPGSCAFPLRASNSDIFAATPAKHSGASFAAFPPDIGRRVVSSGGFTFPVLGQAKVAMMSNVDEPPRESLEVFRPIDEDSVVIADPPPALAVARGRGGLPAGFPRAPAVVVTTAMDEDAMSDASSDLFDLESFAASSSYPTTYRGRSSRRNSREDDLAAYTSAATVEPALSECMYAPSEVSVVWSVATADGGGGAFDAASAANFSSAASACCVEEFRFVPPDEAHDGFTAAMSRSAGRKKGGGGGFLNSCRCEKAVSVGPTPVKVVRPPAHPEAAAKTGRGHAMGLGSSGAARYHHGRVHMPVRT